MSGKPRNSTIGPKWEENFLYNGQLTTDCHHVPAAFCQLHRDKRISLIISEKLGTLSDPEATRGDKHSCVKPMLTDRDNQATGNREPANEMNREGISVWLQPFTVNLEDLEAHVLAHSSERANSDSEGDATKVEAQKRKHSVHAYFRKNQKRSILRSEKYGDLTTAEHKILNEGRESRNNHRYAVVVQKSVSNQNFTRDGEEFTKADRNRRRRQKLSIRTIYQNLASVVKNYHGIIEQLHFIDQRQAELQNELYVE